MGKSFVTLGTIVKIKDVDIPFMIIEYNYKNEDKVNDYLGIPFPMGCSTDGKTNLAFDIEKIESIYSLGYIDEKKIKMQKAYERM